MYAIQDIAEAKAFYHIKKSRTSGCGSVAVVYDEKLLNGIEPTYRGRLIHLHI